MEIDIYYRSTKSDKSNIMLSKQEAEIAEMFGIDPVQTQDYHYKMNIPSKYCDNYELMLDVLTMIGCDGDECNKVWEGSKSSLVHHNSKFDSLNGTSLIEDITISWTEPEPQPHPEPPKRESKIKRWFSCFLSNR